MKQQEATLRGLVDRKYDGKIKEIPRKREDLIENFHWIIMRARRNKKMTVTQFAKEIGESEAVVKMAEQGVLPDGDYNIVKKIEAVLSINILKREFAQKAEHKKRLGFDEFSTKTLTISDLHEMKKDEIEVKPEQEPYWKRLMNALTRKKAPVQASAEEEKPVQQNEVDDEIETGNLREIPIEFNNTTLEITGSLEEAEQEDRIKKAPEDLTDKDIDDLIFGKKK
jgi:ribosome-binding protein aMBF1 (putative translation factor)